MANLADDSGYNKAISPIFAESICRDFCQHDKGEMAPFILITRR
jgi:hypothetical protein